MSMKILKPTNKMPPRAMRPMRGKYIEAYRMVRRLKPGEWLPVEFASSRDAYNFRTAATMQTALNLEARQRGNKVYVRQAKGKRDGA